MNKNGIADIAANIKQIEKLKSGMLLNMASVFEAMATGGDLDLAIDEKLGQIIIDAFLLGQKLGYDYDTINENMLNRLKLDILSFDTPKTEYNELIAWLRKRDQESDHK